MGGAEPETTYKGITHRIGLYLVKYKSICLSMIRNLMLETLILFYQHLHV